MAFQLAKPVCDEIRARVGQDTAQVGETLRPEQQLAYDERPALTDHVVEQSTTSEGSGIPGGVGGGAGYDGRAIFYVGVPDIEAALQKAESLGGTRKMGPEQAPTGLVIGHFTDPEGNLIGLAATA